MEAARISLARFRGEDEIREAMFSRKQLTQAKRQKLLSTEERRKVQRFLAEKSPEEAIRWIRERD